jgi:hypothetical protein
VKKGATMPASVRQVNPNRRENSRSRGRVSDACASADSAPL